MAMPVAPRLDEQPKQTLQPSREYLYRVENRNVPNRVERFLQAFESILRHTNYGALLDLYSRSRARCARCAEVCQVYRVTQNPMDIPCYRTDLLVKIYQRYFTFGGWLSGLASGDGFLTESDIDEMMDAFYRCTACRRCTLECPMGIDHALITHLGPALSRSHRCRSISSMSHIVGLFGGKTQRLFCT